MNEGISTLSARQYFSSVDFDDVTLEARLPLSLVQVGAWAETIRAVEKAVVTALGVALPTEPGCSTKKEDILVMTIAPGTFLIEGSEPDIIGKLVTFIEPAVGTVTNLTDARVVLSVTGAKAEMVLSRGLALDFDLGQFPAHRVKQSAIDEIGVIIRRVAARRFDLYVYQSLALSLWDWLIDASKYD